MLQENSQMIRWYRVREAANYAGMWFLGLGAFVLSVIGVVFILDIFMPAGLSPYWPVRAITNSAIVLGVIGFIAFLCGLDDNVPTGDWLAEIPGGTIILDNESGSVVEVQSEDVVLLKNHPIFGERYKFLKINGLQCVSVTVHPMTENPKVRDITCKLTLKIRERNCENLQVLFDFLHLHEMWKVGRGYGSEYLGKTEVVWEDPVRSMLYDFCNAHSRELSELFNPMRREQRERFESLVHTYFDPLLTNSGIEIKSCSFLVS